MIVKADYEAKTIYEIDYDKLKNEGIKASMAYRRIREAKDSGLLIENNVGMLYFKKKETDDDEKLPF